MLFLEILCDSGKTLFDISVNTGQICMKFEADTPQKLLKYAHLTKFPDKKLIERLLTSKHIFLREWVHTGKRVNIKTGCISYFCVFNMFPYDPNASKMKPKAYHYQNLFFATVIWEKIDILNFLRWGSHQKQSGSAYYINSNVY